MNVKNSLCLIELGIVAIALLGCQIASTTPGTQTTASAPVPSVSSVQPSSLPTTPKSPPTDITLQVGSLREIEGDVTCGRGTGGTMTYAETRNYRIYICADRNDPTQPRFYRSRERNGRGGLNLEAVDYDPRQLRYFEFKNQGYTYILQMPMSQIPNPVLGIEFPNGRRIEERVTRYLAR